MIIGDVARVPQTRYAFFYMPFHVVHFPNAQLIRVHSSYSFSYNTYAYTPYANHAHLMARILTPSHVFSFGRTSK